VLEDRDIQDMTHTHNIVYADHTITETLVVQGWQISIRVEDRHLVIADGIGEYHRIRRVSRGDGHVKRILVLGRGGSITLSAISWCESTGISLATLNNDGRLTALSTGAPSGDARLKRAQAYASTNDVGIGIARYLLSLKTKGQLSILERLDSPEAHRRLANQARELETASDMSELLNVEALCALTYFNAWTTRVSAAFTTGAARRVPKHWLTYRGRQSRRTKKRTVFAATDPINALLNYGYALAEIECRNACLALGLEPSLGVLHVDRIGRDSLALDILEGIRPIVDGHVLDLLAVRRFTYTDFVETPDGSCRLTESTTHTLAQHMKQYATTVAPIAETVANTIAGSAAGRHKRRTPLTRTASIEAFGSTRKTTPTKKPQPSCRGCGRLLPHVNGKWCSTCWPERLKELAVDLSKTNKDGVPASHNPAAKKRRSASVALQQQRQREWKDRHPNHIGDPDDYLSNIAPRLAAFRTTTIASALGVSRTSAVKYRKGTLIPHVRHWDALRELVANE